MKAKNECGTPRTIRKWSILFS